MAAALGLSLPAATHVQPTLTVLAARGLVVVMLLAHATHVARGEHGVIGINVVLGGLAAYVAWGRARRVPILPR